LLPQSESLRKQTSPIGFWSIFLATSSSAVGRFPPRTYLVSRVSDSDLHEIAISSVDTGSTVLTLSAQVQDTSRIQPKITLQHSGDQNFLSKIQTANHVFTIEVPKSAVADAAAKAGGASYQTVTAESSKR